MKKFICVSICVFGMGVLLNACDKKKSDTEQPAPTNNLIILPNPPLLTASQVTATVQKADYEIPVCRGDQCPKVDIQRLKTNVSWVNQFLDNQILKLSQSVTDQLGRHYSLQQNVDAFVKLSNEDAKNGGLGVPYTMSIRTEYLGSHGENLVQFKVGGEFYTGGAHGSAVNHYYVLDLSQHKQLKLNDLIGRYRENQVYGALYPEFVRWVKSSDSTVNLKEYEAMWKFTLAHDFTLDQKGLTFYYGQYEIGPYSVGMPEFTIPYTKLNGIIKPEYL